MKSISSVMSVENETTLGKQKGIRKIEIIFWKKWMTSFLKKVAQQVDIAYYA